VDLDQADKLNELIRAVGLRHRTLCIEALEQFGIHPGHKLLLFELERAGPRTLTELSVACGYEPPTITISIRQLESLGLVERRPSQTDKRVTIVELTERGTELLAKVKAAWHDVAELTLAGLGRTSFKQLQTVLTDLAASLAATDQPTRYLHPPPPR